MATEGPKPHYAAPRAWGYRSGSSPGLAPAARSARLLQSHGDADKLVWMRFRSSMLVILSLVLTFNGAGIGNAHAHQAAPEHAHGVLHPHSMPAMEHADCLEHAHATAMDNVEHEQHPDEDHSGGSCCKTPFCGCSCVGTNVSVVPAAAGFTTVVDHGFVLPTHVAIYDSPVLRHLIRPPILQALQAP